MFTGFNKYEAELIDAAKQREASSADVGTGWQAMTQASGRAGGMIGRTVGKALGGVTTAEQRLQDFQAITSTMPNFDFNNVEHLQEMSSKLWQGGFYDQGKELMDTANIYQRNLAEVANIEQQTSASEASTELERDKFDLSKTISEAQIDEIEQQIKNLKSDVKVDEQQIKESQENVKRSEALTKDLSLTDQAKNFEFAQKNGNYAGTFEDYQKLVANLKTVATEGSINLYDYARTKAGGSYEGTLEEFITSVTGVDYKKALRDDDNLKITYYSYGKTEKTRMTTFLNKEIDTGTLDFIGNVEDAIKLDDASGNYTKEQVGEHLFQLGKNVGQDPQAVWAFYKDKSGESGGNLIDFIMNLPVTKTLAAYEKYVPQAEQGGGGGADKSAVIETNF